MPSTFSTSGGYELQATGENNNTWGVKNNVTIQLLDERIDGVASAAVAGDYSITISNAVSSDGRNAVQVMNGTPAADFTVTLPARELNRWFKNNTGKTATITLGSGTTCTIRDGQLTFVYTDGSTGCWNDDTTLDKVKAPAAAVDLNSKKITSLATGTVSTDGVNKGQMDTAITSAIASAVVNVPVQTGEAGKYLKTDGSTPSWDAIDISSSDTTGTLPVNRGGTGATTLTDKGVLIGNGTSAISATAAGTSGHVLTSNGAGVAPTFQAPAGGGSLIFISTQTLSSVAQCDFTSGFSSTYDEFEFHLNNVKPASAQALWMRTSTNAGSSFDAGASDYSYAEMWNRAGSATPTGNASTGDSKILLIQQAVGAGANENGASLVVRLIRPTVAKYAQVDWRGNYNGDGTGTSTDLGAGQRLTAADVDAVRFLFASGNIASGIITMYGVKKS